MHGLLRNFARKAEQCGNYARPFTGLRTAPRSWQGHAWSTLKSLGLARLMSEPNVYRHDAVKVYIYAYVDDLLVIGREDRILQR